jgi:hypothetical protein
MKSSISLQLADPQELGRPDSKGSPDTHAHVGSEPHPDGKGWHLPEVHEEPASQGVGN